MSKTSLDNKYYDTVVKKKLHPTFWNSELEFDSNIADRLVIIAEKFYDTIGLDAKVHDILLIGSIANYNWTSQSDLDVHIILDYADISYDEELVNLYLDLERKEWNNEHDIEILDTPVEVSFNDISEKINSAGQYSLLHKKWIQIPERPSSITSAIKDEANRIYYTLASSIDEVCDKYENNSITDLEAYQASKRIWKVVKKLRGEFLPIEGEYGPKNLAFKRLRNNEYLEKITSLKTETQDNILSIYTK